MSSNREAAFGAKEATNRWLLPSQNLKFLRELGKGGFGTVWLASLHGTLVAVKKNAQKIPTSLQLSMSTTEFIKNADLRHPQIVQLIGLSLRYATDSPEIEPLLVFEFLPNGTLEEWIFSPCGVRWDDDLCRSVSIAHDVLRGLAYLQLNSPPIVHGDLKTSNVFLDRHMRAKIGDVAGCVNLYNTDGHQHIQVTPLFSSPQQNQRVFAQDFSYASLSDDIYSFGAVLFEIFTKHDAFSDLSHASEIGMAVASGTRRLCDEYPPEVIHRSHGFAVVSGLISITNACTEFDSADRPSAEDLIEAFVALESMVQPQECGAEAMLSGVLKKEAQTTAQTENCALRAVRRGSTTVFYDCSRDSGVR
eukprot:TRINITY_DN7147_c0_g1_i3.p1 TRINITY_DN7147_c0_g1~~TRINITY_DN7147_c0_g1_i3.p1  ORF type:complete len:362 (+),score=59.36 TRINITY_DN7147_c0_g1_i3:580-1665(+)